MDYQPSMSTVLGSRALASDVRESVARALRTPCARVPDGRSARQVFHRSLRSAIRDIEVHPRGKLFRRLIEYGPVRPGTPEVVANSAESMLSDLECASCVEFIHSHMVNRFKGELAELLSLKPCIELVERLQHAGRLPNDVQLYWGDYVQERPQSGAGDGALPDGAPGFTKGADGLLVQLRPGRRSGRAALQVHGVVEVKSMVRSTSRVLRQVDAHISRLAGGLRLAGRTWRTSDILVSRPLLAIVVPAAWRLSRGWRTVQTSTGSRLVLPRRRSATPVRVEELERDVWRITLGWSQEALSEAAYEMTFWYMSQVGMSVYTRVKLPEAWATMTPEEAGYNAIKEALYYMLLRPLSKRQDRLATRLYNVYAFGYAQGADSRDMLWPEDFRDDVTKRTA